MKRKIGFILALVLIAFLVIGSVSAGWFDFFGGDEKTTVENNDTNFIVGFDSEFPPYGFTNDKENTLDLI